MLWVFLQKLFRKHRIIFLANTAEELDLLIQNDMEAILCNHNCFNDENIYKPLNIEKKYDAIYDARLSPFKRHELCAKTSKLALITYIHELSQMDEYEIKIKELLSNAHWFNYSTNENSYRLSDIEVNEAINQSKVGLCLSEIEGAMNASIQYLLAGMPVVNVPNKGGRDLFFDDYNSTTVEPDALKVAQAVEEMIKRNPSPQIIRDNVIKLIWEQRDNFIDLVNKIYSEEGVDRNFRDEWDSKFYNKFIRWVSYKEVV